MVKNIALVAHDSRKAELMSWVKFNAGVLGTAVLVKVIAGHNRQSPLFTGCSSTSCMNTKRTSGMTRGSSSVFQVTFRVRTVRYTQVPNLPLNARKKSR